MWLIEVQLLWVMNHSTWSQLQCIASYVLLLLCSAEFRAYYFCGLVALDISQKQISYMCIRGL